jgi:PmbA protein
MERIMELAKKVAEAAEVFAVTAEETPVQFEANRLKHIQSRQSRVVALRIIKNGRVGYSITTDTDDISSLVNSAVETAEFGTKAGFELPILKNYPKVDTYDLEVEKVPLERMIALGQEMIDAVRGRNAEIICEGSVDRDITSVRILNSRGGEASYIESTFSLGIEGSLIRGTDMLFVGENESSCHPLTDTGAVTDEVLRQLEWAKEQAAAPTKPVPVIFTPNGVASAIVSPLMAAFNGKIVLQGASPIGDKLGEPVFDKKMYLWDDATIAYRPASCPFDDEGVPSQSTTLVEGGVPASFLYDLQTAALAKKQSTGNGSRHGGGLPSPSPSAFVIHPGKTNFDDMLADIKEGLVVEYLMGAGQGNVLGGDFSGNVLLGYKVENGKIAGRVKDTMVSGNIYKLLKDIAAIGSDTKWVGGSLSTPSLYFNSVSVASKG